jgi:AraC-like DNA-binding protein
MHPVRPGGAPAANQPIKLAGQVLCTSDDLDEYRDNVNAVFYPARIEPVGPRAQLSHAWLSAAQLNHLTLGIVHFGTRMLVDPGDIGGYHLNVPLHGAVTSVCGAQQVVATPSRAAVFTPGTHTVLPSWEADATQVCLKIERAALETELGRILGHPVDRRVRFDLGFDLSQPAGRRWRSTLQILIDALNSPDPLPDAVYTHEIDYLERILIVDLLVHQGHSMSQAVHHDRGGESPSAVAKVVDLVHDAPGAQYTVADLAQASGVGARQLQKLFHERFGMSPTAYLRNVRLDGIRAELLAESEATVSAVAFRWGFNHLGHFAQHYQRKFGESPSQTRRRREKT